LAIVLTIKLLFSKDEIIQNHASISNTLNIPGHVGNHNELPYLYWIPKLHKAPYQQRYFLVPKMFYKTVVNTPHKNFNCREGKASFANTRRRLHAQVLSH
jgi:hypothetical protein